MAAYSMDTMLPKLTISAAIMMVLLTGSAFAQVGSSGLVRPATQEPTRTQIERKKAEEKAYQSAVSKIPDQAHKLDDPWGGVRPTPPTPVKKK